MPRKSKLPKIFSIKNGGGDTNWAAMIFGVLALGFLILILIVFSQMEPAWKWPGSALAKCSDTTPKYCSDTGVVEGVGAVTCEDIENPLTGTTPKCNCKSGYTGPKCDIPVEGGVCTTKVMGADGVLIDKVIDEAAADCTPGGCTELKCKVETRKYCPGTIASIDEQCVPTPTSDTTCSEEATPELEAACLTALGCTGIATESACWTGGTPVGSCQWNETIPASQSLVADCDEGLVDATWYPVVPEATPGPATPP